MKLQCCVCLRVKEPNAWVHVRNQEQVRHSASHTYCPRCLDRVRPRLLAAVAASA